MLENILDFEDLRGYKQAIVRLINFQNEAYPAGAIIYSIAWDRLSVLFEWVQPHPPKTHREPVPG